MMIDISKGIQVGGLHFAVEMNEKTHGQLLARDNSGECDMRNLTIIVDPDQPPEMISKVFIHEVIEAVNWIYCDSKIEHERIQQLSYGIHQVMESLGVRYGIRK